MLVGGLFFFFFLEKVLLWIEDRSDSLELKSLMTVSYEHSFLLHKTFIVGLDSGVDYL